MKYDWAGIDYGAKLAGTTVICYADNDGLQFLQVEKKVDADKWLIEQIQQHKFSKILLDAPLSLPKAYYGDGDNFFYRNSDVLTSAMSPMFLGGLTARAMKLKSQLSDIKVIETYPGYLVRKVLSLSELYFKKKKFSDDILQHLIPILPLKLGQKPENWHQLDALLCWISGYRLSTEQALIIGEKEEGQITI